MKKDVHKEYGAFKRIENGDVAKAREELIETVGKVVLDICGEIVKGDTIGVVFQLTPSSAGKAKRPWTMYDVRTDPTCAGYVPFDGLIEPADYKQRMVREYRDTKTRYNRLHRLLIRHEAGTLDFEPTCPPRLLYEQKMHMGEYLRVLEVRAEIEGIKLPEVH